MNNYNKKIAYIAPYDATNVESWSGVPYHMSQAIKSKFNSFGYISPLKQSLYAKKHLKLKQLSTKILLNKRYLKDWHIPTLKSYGQQINDRLSASSYDAIISPVTYPLAYVGSKQSIAFWVDATFAGLIGYYPWHSNLSQESIDLGNQLEQAVLDKCKLAIYSSQWAADTAMANYKVEPSKVHVIPFGANIECNRKLEDIKTIIQAKSQKVCKLLFLGRDWERKGGNTALSVAELLNKRGVKTELHLVGCNVPENISLPNYVKQYGFISKKTKEGKKSLDKLMSESHFLILPSRAECYGVVFADASSYGLPSLTTKVGGIPTAIKDGRNGMTFALDENPERYCDFIETQISSKRKYAELVLSSFQEYSERLNWSAGAEKVKQLL